jgi:hypothetical protein
MTVSLQDLIYKNDYKVPKRDPSKGLLKLEKLEIWYPEVYLPSFSCRNSY